MIAHSSGDLMIRIFKNIPLPSQNDFLQRLTEKTEQFLRRMRWKAYFFLNPDVSTSSKDTYGHGNPGTVIVPQYGSSKITVFVWGKNIILKFLVNTE